MDVILHKDKDAVERLFSACSNFSEGIHEYNIFQDRAWMKNWWRYKKSCQM